MINIEKLFLSTLLGFLVVIGFGSFGFACICGALTNGECGSGGEALVVPMTIFIFVYGLFLYWWIPLGITLVICAIHKLLTYKK